MPWIIVVRTKLVLGTDSVATAEAALFRKIEGYQDGHETPAALKRICDSFAIIILRASQIHELELSTN